MRDRYLRWEGGSTAGHPFAISMEIGDLKEIRLSSLILRTLLLAVLAITSISGALGDLQVSLSGPASPNGDAFINACDPSPMTYYEMAISNPVDGASEGGIQTTIVLPEGFYYTGLTEMQFPGWTYSSDPESSIGPDGKSTRLTWNISQSILEWKSSTSGTDNRSLALSPGENLTLRFGIGAGCTAQSGQVLTADLTCTGKPTIGITSSPVPLHRAELQLIRESGQWSKSPGDAVNWSISVQNAGDGPAYNAVLNDTLDSGLILMPGETSPAPDSVSSNPTILTWNLGDMPPGDSQTATISAMISSSGDLSDNSSVSWGCGEGLCGTAQNQSDEAKPGSLVITNHQAGKADPCGDPADLQIQIKSTGAGSTYNISVSESLPEGMEIYRDLDHPQGWYTVTSIPEGINATSTDISGGLIKWRFDSSDGWAPGTVVTIDLKANVTNACSLGAGGIASAQASYSLPNGTAVSTETQSAAVDVYNPVLSISQAPSVVSAKPGEAATWSIVIRNTGDCTAKHVQVKDWLPSNLYSPSSNRTFNGTGTQNDPIVWDLSEIEPGGTIGISLAAIAVPSSGCMEDAKNTARIYWGCCQDASMSLASDSTLITRPSLTASLITDAISTCGGTYVATVSNPSDALDVASPEIIDVFPEGLEYVSGSARIISPEGHSIIGGPSYDSISRTLNLTIDSIDKSETLTLALDLKNCPACCSSASQNTTTSLILKYRDECGNIIAKTKTWPIELQLPILSVSKTPKIQEADGQGLVSWDITVNNIGTGRASNMEITDALGNSFTDINSSDGTPAKDAHTGWTTITWSGQAIDAGSTWQRHITARLTNPQGDATNSVEVKGSCISDGCTYSQAPKDTATATLVTASKGPDQTGIPGQDIDFPVDIMFSGNAAYDNVSLTDALPSELDYVSGICTGCGGEPQLAKSEGKTILTWDLGSFTGPRPVSFTVSTRINASAKPGQNLTNHLNVSYASGGRAFQVPASADIAIIAPASLGDLVWDDANANGLQDPGEAGIAGVEVDILKSGAASGSTTTDASGGYHFTGLAPGSYSLKFNLPSGYIFSAPGQGSNRSMDSDADQSLGKTSEVMLNLSQIEDTVDAGMYKPASIGDLVWKDVNSNGIQDSGEPGMPGIIVELLRSGSPAGATSTDLHGAYRFEGLIPGNYSLKFILPEGYAFSAPGQGGDAARDSDANVSTGMTDQIMMASGQRDATWDAGIYQNASIGDLVWEDLNGNGVQDEPEPGIGNASVMLYTSSGTLVGSNITNSTGHFAFTALPPGDYYLNFTRPEGYSFTIKRHNIDRAVDSDAGSDGKTGTISLTSGQNDTTWDAGLYRNMSLGDIVWDDLNTNGIQDEGEPGIEGVAADLYKLDLNAGTYLNVASNITGRSGSYSFSSLAPGIYHVIFEKPSEYVFSPANQGSDLTRDSDVCVVTGQTGDVQMESGLPNDTIDAGMFRLASIGDLVWSDLNADGIQSESEPGMPGVQVELFKSDASLGTASTDSNGSYSFAGLSPGNYSLKFDLPASYVFSAPEQGADISKDSNADVGTGRTASIALASGESNTMLDAGIYQNATLGDFVWEDLNGNGIQDESEPGIGNAEVRLYTSNGTLAVSNITDSTGRYALKDIFPGDYYIEFIKPDGYVFTINNLNADRANDSDARADGKTDNLTLTSGQIDLTRDAGLYRNASLGDFVWNDSNTNGIQDLGEPGIPGAIVDLYRLDSESGTCSKVLTNTTDANGNYSFTPLIPGRYYVVFEKPVGYLLSPADQGDDQATDSNADAGTGQTGDVQLDSGQSDCTVDAGMFRLASIRGHVWNDLSSNGTRDEGEPGIAGVQVSLHDCMNNTTSVLASTSTDAVGSYNFSDLLPGTYSVGFAFQEGYNFTLQDQGSNDSLDSDANQSDGNTICIPLVAGQDETAWDAGLAAIQPPLTVEKTTESELIVPESEVNSTIKITNTGDAALQSVTAVDRLPEGMSYVSDNRTGSVSGQNVTWSDLGALGVGNSTYIELACRIDEGASGTLTDVVNVTGNVSDEIVIIGSTQSNLAIMKPDVEIRSSVDQADAMVCTEVVYTLNVTNTGNFTLNPVKVMDALPAGMDFNSSEPAPSNITMNSNGTTGISWDNIGPMEPGAGFNISIISRLNEWANGTMESHASAEAVAPDGTVVGSSDSVSINATPSIIGVSNDAGSSSAPIRANVTFTVRVTNLGSQALDPVKMVYTMPKGLDFVSTDSTQPYTASKGPDGVWMIYWEDMVSGPLQDGGSSEVSLAGRINDDVTGTLVTEARVTGILPNAEKVDYCPMVAGVSVEVPRIDVVKAANISSGAPGSDIGFDIKITNNGDLMLNPVRAVDILPAGLSYIADNRSGSVSGRNISWDSLGLLNPGASTAVHIIARIDKDASGMLDNRVEATGESIGGSVRSSSDSSVRALVPGIDVEKTVGLKEPSQYSQFCDSKTVSGNGRVESAMAIKDRKIALAYNDAMDGEGDIELSSVQAMSEKAGKLQRDVPSLNGTNRSAMNFFESSKISFRGDTPLTGSKSIRSESLSGGMGASVEESFQADQMEKDQATYFGSTANATGAQVVGVDTNSSFNGTMEAAQSIHKMFDENLRSHSRFSGKFELERNVKLHENATEKRRDPGCEGIDC